MTPMDVVIEGMIFAGEGAPGEKVTARPPTEEEIAEAERELGAKLPPSYREFMDRAGEHLLPDWDIYWVGGGDLMLRNIVVANDVERAHSESPLPEFLIAFHDDEGDQYCFDTRRPDESDEYPIVLWDREKSAEANLEGLYVAATDFIDWVKSEVKASS